MDSCSFPFFFPADLTLELRVRRGEEPSGENVLRLIQIRLAASSFEKSRRLVKIRNRQRSSCFDIRRPTKNFADL